VVAFSISTSILCCKIFVRNYRNRFKSSTCSAQSTVPKIVSNRAGWIMWRSLLISG